MLQVLLMKILCTITIHIFFRLNTILFLDFCKLYCIIYFRSEVHLLTYCLNKIFKNDFDRPNKVMIECNETTKGFVGK